MFFIGQYTSGSVKPFISPLNDGKDKSRIYRLGTLPSKTPCGFYVSIFVYWSKIPWGEKMGSAMGIKVGEAVARSISARKG